MPGARPAPAAGGVRLHGCGRYGARVPAAWCGCWLRCCDRPRSCGARALYQLTSSGFRCFCPFYRGGCEQSPPQGSCFFSSLGADARRPPSFFTRRYRMPCAAKKRRAAWRVSFFVTTHRFCCLHSRPPQGRGSVRGEPLTGSPARVQSPARRRPLLRSKSAAPKKKDTHVGVFLFCDCP